MPMARAEQYRNLYPFLGVAQSHQGPAAPSPPHTSHSLGFSQLSPTLGFWPPNPEALQGGDIEQRGQA